MTERLDAIQQSLQSLQKAEQERRRRAGPQLQRDHDHSARWIGPLPTFQPNPPKNP